MTTDPYNSKGSLYKFRDMLTTIAQRTYPFTETNEAGEKLYLDRAYSYRYGKCEAELGSMPNMKCWRIFIWSEILHIWAGIMFWALALLIDYYLGAPWSLILPIGLLAWFAFQEFYLDRVKYNQPWLRGIIDWIIWVIPMALFIFIHVV